MKKAFTTTANKVVVYLDQDRPHLKAHREDFSRPLFLTALKYAVNKININNDFLIESINIGFICGASHCVEVTNEDKIVWIAREGREIKSKIVLNREPENTTYVTVGICKDHTDGKMTIFTAWAGPKAERELTDPRLTDEERPRAEAFWANHALVL